MKQVARLTRQTPCVDALCVHRAIVWRRIRQRVQAETRCDMRKNSATMRMIPRQPYRCGPLPPSGTPEFIAGFPVMMSLDNALGHWSDS